MGNSRLHISPDEKSFQNVYPTLSPSIPCYPTFITDTRSFISPGSQRVDSIGNAVVKLDERITETNRRIGSVEKKAYSGVAIAIAMSGNYTALGKQSVGLGVGTIRVMVQSAWCTKASATAANSRGVPA